MPNISLIDNPVKDVLNDALSTSSYAKALAEFTKECRTPMTIGIQGEWGSGKTSLLNMMQYIIENEEVKSPGRSSSILGTEAYKIIWVNTWEHSLLKSAEETLLSIIDEIINAISQIDGSWRAAQKAKSALSLLAKGAMRIGTAAALGKAAAEQIGDAFTSTNSIHTLRLSLQESIKELIERDKNSIKRFIIFIDDLDRLEPSVAVMILELLKNIFDIENCVFVLAIDYQVVVKGLKNKFGEPNENNEWEFRAFFDKIIQLPFVMPIGAYNIESYVESLLLETSYFTAKELTKLKSSSLSKMIQLTIGTNPRALKRLVNSLSLILLQRRIQNNETILDNEFVIKQLLIAFVSIQISYPKLYNLILKSPIFYEWNEDFLNRVIDSKNVQDQSIEKALEKVSESNPENFDEIWEQTLFRIMWANNWHKNRIIEISKALSIIKEKILPILTDELKEKILKESLNLTAVTSVITMEDGFSLENQDDDNKLYRIPYWQDFAKNMSSCKSLLPYDSKSSIYSSWDFILSSDSLADANLDFIFSIGAKSMLRIKTKRQMGYENAFNFMNWLKKYSSELENATGVKPKFKNKENDDYQMLQFSRPDGTFGDLSLPENLQKKQIIFTWLTNNIELIEKIIIKAYEEFLNAEKDN